MEIGSLLERVSVSENSDCDISLCIKYRPPSNLCCIVCCDHDYLSTTSLNSMFDFVITVITTHLPLLAAGSYALLILFHYIQVQLSHLPNINVWSDRETFLGQNTLLLQCVRLLNTKQCNLLCLQNIYVLLFLFYCQ